MNKKKGCLLCGNFISIYVINRTLHGRLEIRILSSRAESISHSFAALIRERYFQHSKIKLASPRGHVISSMYPTPPCTLAKVPRPACAPAFSKSVKLRIVQTHSYRRLPGRVLSMRVKELPTLNNVYLYLIYCCVHVSLYVLPVW